MARYRHDQTLVPALSPEDKNSPRLGRPATSLVAPLPSDPYGQRNAEESESTMSSYLTLTAIMLLVLSPLFVPVAITVAPWLTSGVRRIRRAFGLYHPARV
jgi:hypothetical protein